MHVTNRLWGYVTAVIVFLTIVSVAQAKYGGGSGIVDDPYQIWTAEQMNEIGANKDDWGKHFKLMADVDLGAYTGTKFNIIGYWRNPSDYKPFTGVFDGNSHVILNFTHNSPDQGYVGLFGYVATSNLEIKNLGLIAAHVEGTSCVGLLVGYLEGTVTNCYARDGIAIGSEHVGGLVGHNRGKIVNSYSTGSVAGENMVGSLVGDNYKGTITNCYSTSNVTGGKDVGGLVGLSNGAVSYSFWDIQTSGQTKSAGGTGKTTAEMRTVSTFLFWGTCGNEGIWTIDEGKDYPRLWWEKKAGKPIAVAAGLCDLLTGEGTKDNPYLIYTGEELNLVGLFPCDWDKHFKLMADIDLSGFSYEKALIAPDVDTNKYAFDGTTFTGVFDGNGHTIWHLRITGKDYLGMFGQLASGAEVSDLGVADVNITGSGDYVGGLVGENYYGSVTRCYSYITGVVTGGQRVGGLVGENQYGSVVSLCYSIGAVGGGSSVGGLVGGNTGKITNSYATGNITGSSSIGGLVGVNSERCVGDYWGFLCYPGVISNCYSAGAVSGTGSPIGGLVGSNHSGTVTSSFWDIQASGQDTSAGGIGKTTAEMRMAKTFLDFWWDFVGETKNGTEDTWWILEGRMYPTLSWASKHKLCWAFSPNPWNGAVEISCSPILQWTAGEPEFCQDVYFGDDEAAVADATSQTQGIYRGRQAPDMTTYAPGLLKWRKTYYWRIDEVSETDPNSPYKGKVWSFTTADFFVVEDFEDYNDYTNLIYMTWVDGYGSPSHGVAGNGSGSTVGNLDAPYAETRAAYVHSGRQSMPLRYNNTAVAGKACYSEAVRTWDTPQDWTVDGADTLTLYFRGKAGNGREPLYAGIEDSAGRIAVVVHPDANAVLTTQWRKWDIALACVQAAGVDVAAVKKMYIGVGVRKNPKPGGTGIIYIDDIWLTYRNYVVGDFDGDGYTDFIDFCILAAHWLQSEPPEASFYCGGGGTDLTNDGFIDFDDLMALADNWLKGVAR